MLLEFHHFLEGLVEFGNYYKKKSSGSLQDEYAYTFLKATLDDLPPMLHNDLKLFFRRNAFYPVVFTSESILTTCPDYPALKTLLKSMSADEFVSLILTESRYGEIDVTATEDEQVKQLEETYRTMGEDNAILRSYREFRRFPDEMIHRYSDFLDKMYEVYFKKEVNFIERELQTVQIRHQTLLENHTEAFIKEVIKVDFSSIFGTSEIDYRFYLGYLNTGRISYAVGETSVLCFYNYLFERHFDPAYDTARKTKLFKALADETRIEILKIVAKRDAYAAELADQLNMTKATMSYHLNLLAGQNILSIRMGIGKRVYYSLNTNVLGRYFNEFVTELADIQNPT